MFNVGDKVQLSNWCVRRTDFGDYVREFQDFAKKHRETILTIVEVADDETFRINIGSMSNNCHRKGWWLEEREMVKAKDLLPKDLFEI